jgi:hypothetical protein
MSNSSGTVYHGNIRYELFKHLKELLEEYKKVVNLNDEASLKKKKKLKDKILYHYTSMYIDLPEREGRNVGEVHHEVEAKVMADIEKLEREKREVFWEHPLRNFLFGSPLLGEYNDLLKNRKEYSTYLEGSRPPSEDDFQKLLIDNGIRPTRRVSYKASRSAKHGRGGGKKNRRKTRRGK